MAAVLRRQGQLDESMQQCCLAMRIDPNNTVALNNLGAAFAAKGDRTAAIDHFRQALRVDPNNQTARQGLKHAEQRLRGNAQEQGKRRPQTLPAARSRSRETSDSRTLMSLDLPASLSSGGIRRLTARRN